MAAETETEALASKMDEEKAVDGAKTEPTPRIDGQYQYTTRETILIVSLISLSILLAALDSTIVATASPVIVSQLDGMSLYSWIGTSYMLTSTALQPLWGKLSDIFGRKRSLLFVVIVFLAGSAFCGAAPSMITLIVARAIQGIGGGGIFAITYVVVSEIVPLRERGKYTGIIASTWALASILGPLLGGVFTDTISWRWAFWINLPFGVPSILGILVFLRLPPPKGTIRDQISRVDWVGSGLCTAAITILLLGLSLGGTTYPWSHPGVIICLILPFILIALFVVWESRYAKEPVIPMGLFTASNARYAFITTFSIGVNMFGMSYFLPLYLQVVKSYSATQSGLVSLPASLVVSFVIMAAGFATSRTGKYLPFVWIGSIINVALTSLFLLFNETTSLGELIGVSIAQGFGMALVMQNIVLTSQTAVPDRLIGPVSSVAIFLRTIGGTVGLAVLGTVFSNAFSSHLSSKLVPIVDKISVEGGNTDLILSLFGASVETSSLLASLKSLPYSPQVIDSLRDALLSSEMWAVHLAFAAAIPFAGIGLVATLFLRHVPLRTTSSLQVNLEEEAQAQKSNGQDSANVTLRDEIVVDSDERKKSLDENL
ncbi:MFS general substrate transporter [Gonapodya prolifera JEL478]|uniref:MFS general substrate transporter n=1 Tax=Gonapodya prolifera (strain JEL478) TaxID=1344416 RepID=A0A139AMZ2_GONPJ|nr:MFS general substrate transporter [Gonapodya prolifera JEL478]|eukprot:KXS18130.1 MFS general substrate transporter [Gonapodya prolifera JEL478]